MSKPIKAWMCKKQRDICNAIQLCNTYRKGRIPLACFVPEESVIIPSSTYRKMTAVIRALLKFKKDGWWMPPELSVPINTYIKSLQLDKKENKR